MNMTNRSAGFTLIECLLALVLATLIFTATLSALGFARAHNQVEQERCRAHQIVCQALETERFNLFPKPQSGSIVTVWDNGTPTDPADDTTGELDITVRNPATGATLAKAPDPAILIEIEATLTWHPRAARWKPREMHETVITYKAP
jgi:prepilin-type N-terminal cleavage/methylation domain-containing protein